MVSAGMAGRRTTIGVLAGCLPKEALSSPPLGKRPPSVGGMHHAPGKFLHGGCDGPRLPAETAPVRHCAPTRPVVVVEGTERS